MAWPNMASLMTGEAPPEGEAPSGGGCCGAPCGNEPTLCALPAAGLPSALGNLVRLVTQVRTDYGELFAAVLFRHDVSPF